MPTPASIQQSGLWAVASFLLLLAGCQVPPQVSARLERSPELVTVNPNDIAVLPVEDASPGGHAAEILEFMRQEVQAAIIKRNYVPLRSVHVDANIRRSAAPGSSTVEASFLKSVAKKAQEDALLAVRIRHWDQSSLLINNRVAFDVEVALYGSEAGKILWSGDMRGEVIAGGKRAAPRDPRDRAKAAVREVVRELIGRMPRRQG